MAQQPEQPQQPAQPTQPVASADPTNDPQPVEGDVPGFAPPQQEERVERRYIVVGTQPVLEHSPGEVFTATLSAEQEENFLTYGQLALAPEAQQPQSQPEASQPPQQSPGQGTR